MEQLHSCQNASQNFHTEFHALFHAVLEAIVNLPCIVIEQSSDIDFFFLDCTPQENYPATSNNFTEKLISSCARAFFSNCALLKVFALTVSRLKF